MTSSLLQARVQRFIESEFGHTERVQKLTGGLTNETFLLQGGGQSAILRVSSNHPFVDRLAERTAQSTAAAAGLAPEIRAIEDDLWLVEFVQGEPLTTKDLGSAETCQRLHNTLRSVQQLNFQQLPKLNPLAAVQELLTDSWYRLDSRWAHCGRLVEQLAAAWTNHRLDDLPYVACHGDPVPPNFLQVGTQLKLIDWEYSCQGPQGWDEAVLMGELRAGKFNWQQWQAVASSSTDAQFETLVGAADLYWGLWSLWQAQNAADGRDGYAQYSYSRLEAAARHLP